MTAYDVVASLYYVRTYPEQRAVHGSAESWGVIDRYTLWIDTGVPTAVFFPDIAHHGNFIFPSSLIDAGHDFMSQPIGSGPFVFEEWRTGDFIQFRANENYFDAERFPNIAYVNWRFIPEGASRTIALETDEVDYIVEVALPDVSRLEANPDITVASRPGAMFNYFLMNNEIAPFDNIHVRHAIDMALDREAMLLVSLDGRGVAITQTMPSIFPGQTAEGTRAFDPEGAIALLAEQGFASGDISFEILVSDEVTRRRAEVAQSNLADVGIITTISQMDHAAFIPVVSAGDYEAAFASLTQSDLSVFMRNMLTSEMIGVRNLSRVNNPELDEIIMRAVTTVDETTRVALLEEAGRMANEYAPYLGTNMNILFRAMNSNLIAPEFAANGFRFFNMMYWVE